MLAVRSPIALLASILLGSACGTQPKARTADRTTPAAPSAARAVPRFEDYPAPVFAGQPVAVSLPEGGETPFVDSILRSNSGEPPNFAGYLRLAEWGCGSPCQMVAFIDVRTGRVLPQTLNTVGGVEFRRDSRLLVADPGRPAPGDPPDCSSCGRTAYYVWRDGRLEPLGSGPHPHLGVEHR